MWWGVLLGALRLGALALKEIDEARDASKPQRGGDVAKKPNYAANYKSLVVIETSENTILVALFVLFALR